jgi:hypothetical protein
MDALIETPENSTIPKWVYGALAGGGAALVGVGLTVGLILAKKQRVKKAQDDIRNIFMEQNGLPDPRLTPRDDKT